MSWEFLKGDAIRLTFIFKENDSVYDDSGATKLRVFCYGNKNKTYFFGDQFYKTDDGEWIATFESERTSGNAGASVLTAQLLDNDGNLINSANINLLVIESNTTTPFVSSPHFKDDALAEIEQAVADAKVQIDNWSDQSSRLANLEQATQDLQLFKSNSGALHCGAKSWFGKNSTTSQSTANITRSACCRIIGNDWEADSKGGSFINYIMRVGVRNAEDAGVILGYYGSYIVVAGAKNRVRTSYKVYDFSVFKPYLKADVNDFCLVFRTDADSVLSGDLYLNNVRLNGRLANTFSLSPFHDAFAIGAGGATKAFTYKDVCVFNFDVSDANAPYTLSDYQQGKPMPVECLDTSAEQRALLAFENYTITNGTTKKIFDYSGNANDATCSGSVKGDNDNRVQRLIDFIKA